MEKRGRLEVIFTSPSTAGASGAFTKNENDNKKSKEVLKS